MDIRETVCNIIKQYGTADPQYTLTIATRMGLIIKYYVFPKGVKGASQPGRIYVNSLYGKREQPGIIAHELGHNVLKHFDTIRPVPEVEKEAETFTDILMDFYNKGKGKEKVDQRLTNLDGLFWATNKRPKRHQRKNANFC